MVRQVGTDHYQFSSYMHKPRWMSIWHQLSIVQQAKPSRALEIGPGPNVFKEVARLFGITIQTLDQDPQVEPDHLGTAAELPFANAHFDFVCGFQVLEHMPYELAITAFQEMARVSEDWIVISLPDARRAWRQKLIIPRVLSLDFLVQKPQVFLPRHKFDGQHYWEVNTRGHSLKQVVSDFSRIVPLARTFRIVDNPAHRFFVFRHEGN